jgi:hypothetical protein
MFGETDARPSALLDTLMLVRQIRPGVLLRLFGIAAKGNEAARRKAIEMIRSKGGNVSAALDYVAACLGLSIPDKSFQKPENWCITPLDGQRLTYVEGDVALPLQILRFLLPSIAVEEMYRTIETKYPWYLPFAETTIRLAEAHVRGVPFDFEAAAVLKAEYLVELAQAVDELMQVPEFSSLSREDLADPEAGEKHEMKQALAEHAGLHGIGMPKTEKDGISTSRKSLILCGATKLPAWPLYEKLKAAKKALSTIEDYKQAAGHDGRVHSNIKCITSTGRMASSDPNLQAVPRDPRFRGLFRAEEGKVILAVDYNSIELRVAAALAERAIADVRARLDRGDEASWFMRLVPLGYHTATRLVCPPEPVPMWTMEWLAEAIPAIAQTVLLRKEQTMASVFRRGLDPHLVTAVDMLRCHGAIDTEGLSTIDWLASHDAKWLKQLKKDLDLERQKAKAVNFGILYGMSAEGLHRYGITDFGLTWTLEEAQEARKAWFDLYPEIRLWHFWTKYIPSRKCGMDVFVLWDPYQGKLKWPEYEPRLFEPTTLANRPFAILEGFKEARNYQGRGQARTSLSRPSRCSRRKWPRCGFSVYMMSCYSRSRKTTLKKSSAWSWRP